MKTHVSHEPQPVATPERSAEYAPPQVIRAEKLAEVTGSSTITGATEE